jgi:hypothetical protein
MGDTMLDVKALEEQFAKDIWEYGQMSERTLQSHDGMLGPSDMGFCRNKAVLTMRGEPRDQRNTMAAQIGTAIHTYLADVFKSAHPDWIVEGGKLTATLPSGVEVIGTPDIIAPDLNAVIDEKSVNEYTWIESNGVSQNHRYQRHLYALAAIQAGLLDESKPIYVGNLYIDRTGKESVPRLLMEEFDPTLTDEIDMWIEDVIYAIKTGEEASKDVVAPVCEKICEFFTVCRGNLPVSDDTVFIEDAETKAAIRMYVEGRDMAKQGDKMKREASSRLSGINGQDGAWQVRWTETAAVEVAGFVRKAGLRIDVVPVKTS